MRTLIDGYNLMYARGLLSRRPSPRGLRKVRDRFLNELAQALGPRAASETAIVFDAAAHPAHLPAETTHKGLVVIFAVGAANADERIEQLIAQHPTPKTLTVISSDHRVQQAASRRRARVLSVEEFLDQLDASPARSQPPAPSPPSAEERTRERQLTPQESAYWQQVFRDLAVDPQIQEELRSGPIMLTDEDIAQIEREVESEF
jgi:predicted RNA-binding protein with PIN domain